MKTDEEIIEKSKLLSIYCKDEDTRILAMQIYKIAVEETKKEMMEKLRAEVSKHNYQSDTTEVLDFYVKVRSKLLGEK